MSFGDDIDRMLEGQAGQFFDGKPGSGRRRGSRERERGSGSGRHRSRSRDRERRGGTGKEARRGGDRREGRREVDGNRSEKREDRLEKERERDQRTVFAAQIHPKNEEREIFDFFSEVGKIVDIQLIRDAKTYKSKGLAYIEFEDRRSVPHALALSGRNLNGYPVLVQMTQSDRAYTQPNSLNMPAEKPKTLHVRHLHKKLTEDDVLPIFNAFGEVRSVDLIEGPDSNEALIEFRRGAEANTAMVQLNGLEVVGMQITVEQAGEGTKSRIGAADAEARSARFEDESGNGGVAMSAEDKQSLMNTLAKRAGLSVPISNNPYKNNQSSSSAPAPPTGVLSNCVLLTNMFDPAKEDNPDFDLEIREDVRDEVSAFGTLRHIFVDKTSRDGRIYLKFEGTSAASKALRSLDGRWFAQNRIVATFQEEEDYAKLFPGV